MAGPEFFQTRMGHKFYEGDVPRIAKALERIADALGAEKPHGKMPKADRIALLSRVYPERTVAELERIDARGMGQAEEDSRALRAIHKLLDGQTWSPDTLDEIADVLRVAGLSVQEPDGKA